MSKPKEIPWPVWAVVTIVVALIGAYAVMPRDGGGNGDPPPKQCDVDISGRYFPERERQLAILISRMSDCKYRIEQPTGRWPWKGTATLDGGSLDGEGVSTTSEAKFRIEGAVRSDRSIEVDYKFITTSDGSPGAGVVHHHVWYPE